MIAFQIAVAALAVATLYVAMWRRDTPTVMDTTTAAPKPTSARPAELANESSAVDAAPLAALPAGRSNMVVAAPLTAAPADENDAFVAAPLTAAPFTGCSPHRRTEATQSPLHRLPPLRFPSRVRPPTACTRSATTG
jgi:hypothetical protein